MSVPTTLELLWQQVRAQPEDRALHAVLADALLERDDAMAPHLLEGLRVGQGPAPRAYLEHLHPVLARITASVTQRWGVAREVALASWELALDDLALEEFAAAQEWAGITRLELPRGPGLHPPPRWLLRRMVENARALRELTEVSFDDLVALGDVDRALERVALADDPDPLIEHSLPAARLRIRTLRLPSEKLATDESALWWLLHHGRGLLDHVEVLEVGGADAECLPFLLDQRSAALREVRADHWTCVRGDDGEHFVLTDQTPQGQVVERLPVPRPVPARPLLPVQAELTPDCPFTAPDYDDFVARLCDARHEAWIDGFSDGAWALTVTGPALLSPDLSLLRTGPDHLPALLDLLPADFQVHFDRAELTPELPPYLLEHPWDPVDIRVERRFAAVERRALLTLTARGAEPPRLQLLAFTHEAGFASALRRTDDPLLIGPTVVARFPARRLLDHLAATRPARLEAGDARVARRRAARLERELQERLFIEADSPF